MPAAKPIAKPAARSASKPPAPPAAAPLPTPEPAEAEALLKGLLHRADVSELKSFVSHRNAELDAKISEVQASLGPLAGLRSSGARSPAAVAAAPAPVSAAAAALSAAPSGAAAPAASEADIAKAIAVEAKKLAFAEAHLWPKAPSADLLDARIAQWEEKIEKEEAKFRDKDDNKAVALGTSKINYMDPRITAAWCKATETPIEKCFPQTLIKKFPWALGVPSTWRF